MTIGDDLNILRTSGHETAKVEALDRIALSDDPEVTQVLLEMAQDPSLAEAIGKAVGNAIAQIYWRQARVNDAPFYLFTAPTGEGFDETVARLDAAARNDTKG